MPLQLAVLTAVVSTRRLPMNRYFLLIATLQLWSTISPVNPATTWGPLAVIFAVTAVKELFDDMGRRRRDEIANTRQHTVIRSGQMVGVESQAIQCGDIVRLVENEEVPCDLVLLATSEANGVCYIQTTNLDGESNLKSRVALSETRQMNDPAKLAEFIGFVHAPPPDNQLYVFDAQLRLDPTSNVVSSLSADQLLLQATHVRNTEFAYGLAVYTGTPYADVRCCGVAAARSPWLLRAGNETKFGNNKSTPAPKLTHAEAIINRFSVIIFVFQLVLVVIFGIIGNVWKADTGEEAWYLAYANNESWYSPLIIPLRFLLLNSTMIPISLKVTLDLCKLYYAKFVNNDLELFDEATQRPAEANSTALGEDLGQVKYVLTDKTGTLTENVMELKCCTINGVVYGSYSGDSLGGDRQRTTSSGRSRRTSSSRGSPAPSRMRNMSSASARSGGGGARQRSTGNESTRSRRSSTGVLLSDPTLHANMHNGDASSHDFFRCLALNNSVIPTPDPNTGALRYKASSPDEEALVRGAAAYGVCLQSRVVNQVVIDVMDSRETYTQLHELEFDSVRKRMSVLVQNDVTRALRLYVKGADDVVLPVVRNDNPRVTQQINAFAAAGLRTLVVAYRDLSQAEYNSWHSVFHAANTAMMNRQAQKWKAYDMIEKDLTLVGATAIEDKLQQGVPDTIALLKEAGLKFWMLTGDKPSTALTIALTCKLMPKTNVLRPVEGEDQFEVGRQLADQLRAEGLPCGLGGGLAGERASFGPVLSPSERNLNQGRSVEMSPLTPESKGAGVGSGSVSRPIAAQRRAKPPGRGKKRPYTVIVKGSALREALKHHRDDFARLAMQADSVICCRVSPAQKAELVQIVKDHDQQTLAIGDGGNDVAMIQRAHVGVGIRGKEGLEASRAADYQVGMFRTLQRLMLVHGRWAYYRTALVAQYSFYKSFAFCFMQIGFTWHSGFAGTSVFNSLCVAAYNAVLFVPIVYFFLDKDVGFETIAQCPQSYALGQQDARMNYRTMGWWFLRALYHAVVMLSMSISSCYWSQDANHYETLGLVVFSMYLWVQDLTMLFELRVRLVERSLLLHRRD